MKKLHTSQEKPQWVKEQENMGRLIFNAARPLWGTETNDTWELPFIHGRHYAAVDPGDDRYEAMVKTNIGLDGVVLVFVTQERAKQIAIEETKKQYPDREFDFDDPKQHEFLVGKGLKHLNEDNG